MLSQKFAAPTVGWVSSTDRSIDLRSVDHRSIDHIDPTLPLRDVVLICILLVVHIQPRKCVLNRAEYMVLTLQRELNHTDHGSTYLS